VLKGVILYKKMGASKDEKTAYDSATVDSDGSNLQLHFKSDDQKFPSADEQPLFRRSTKQYRTVNTKARRGTKERPQLDTLVILRVLCG